MYPIFQSVIRFRWTLPTAILPAGLAAGVCVLNSPPRVEVVLVRVGLTAPPSPIPIPNPPPTVAVLLGMGMANPIAGATVAAVPGAVLVVPGKAGGKVVVPSLKPPLCVDAVLVPNAKPVKETEEIIVLVDLLSFKCNIIELWYLKHRFLKYNVYSIVIYKSNNNFTLDILNTQSPIYFEVMRFDFTCI